MWNASLLLFKIRNLASSKLVGVDGLIRSHSRQGIRKRLDGNIELLHLGRVCLGIKRDRSSCRVDGKAFLDKGLYNFHQPNLFQNLIDGNCFACPGNRMRMESIDCRVYLFQLVDNLVD